MKIRMLGTGYGECKIKKKTVKDFRRCGGVIVDEKILIDAPGDIFDVALELGFSDMFDDVYDVIISHSHTSHFSLEAISKLSQSKKIRVYATQAVLALIPHSENVEKIPLTVSVPITVGEYTLYPLPANHKTGILGECCLNFLLIRDKVLFYGLDGGHISLEGWDVMSEILPDAVILDCALGLSAPSFAAAYHNGFQSAKLIRDILSSKNPEKNIKIVLSHIPSDKRLSVHDELSAAASEYGMSVAYDGYFFSI